MRILLIALLSLSCSDYKLSGMGTTDPGASLPELDTAYAEELPPIDTGVDEPEEEPEPTTPVAISQVYKAPVNAWKTVP